MDIEYLKNNNIDVDTAIDLLGDLDNYNEILKDFYDSLDERLSNINKYKNDLENYSIEVHTLKSNALYLGFNDLADMAKEHQLKSENNDLEYIENNYNTLVNKINTTKEIIKKYLNV